MADDRRGQRPARGGDGPRSSGRGGVGGSRSARGNDGNRTGGPRSGSSAGRDSRPGESRDRKPYGAKSGDSRDRKPYGAKSGDDRKPYGAKSGDSRDRKPYGAKSGDSRKPYAKSGERGGRDDRGARGERPYSRDRQGPARTQEQRTKDQERYDGPPLPEGITGKELDRSITAQLKGLPEKLAARVARHLAAAGQLIDSDPETAYQHTLAARRRASRRLSSARRRGRQRTRLVTTPRRSPSCGPRSG
ncbi:hypothetical protein [Nocardioides daphniae]|uniref:hypothetical protein n=1 Tax=Nocardioides daphniae TaxID=402297 RepID=UPI001EE7B91D|nr:hypothetical protein [Nocardioides daphniae]